MKHTFTNRITAALLVVLAVSIFSASESFGALNAYLQLRPLRSGGKSYKVVPDASGKFTFKDVAPGTYELRLVGSPEYFVTNDFTNAGGDGYKKHPSTIEIESFSWGMSQSSGSGKGSGGGAGKMAAPSAADPNTEYKGGVHVAAGDVNGDGLADMAAKEDHIPSAISVSLDNPTRDGGTYYKVVLKEVMVSSICSPSGNVKGGWNLKENVK